MSGSSSSGKKVAIAGVFAVAALCLIASLTTSAISMRIEEDTQRELATKAKEAPKALSEIVKYITNYKETHNGEWPGQYCDTEKSDGEWIDNIAGNSEYFTFFYATDFAGNIYVEAEGKAEPFCEKDTLSFYFVKAERVTNNWQATGKLACVKPTQSL